MKQPTELTPEQYRATATEAQVQAAICEALAWKGYEVQETSEHRHACSECGTYNHAGSGSTRGIADVLARRRWWPRGLWCQMEIKTATGGITPEQKRSMEMDGLFIVRSPETALALMWDLDRHLVAAERIARAEQEAEKDPRVGKRPRTEADR